MTVDGVPTGRWLAAKDKADALKKLPQDLFKSGSLVEVTQDSDVLDTWFSASLLPFTVFGWPDVDPNPRPEYPLSLMETGYDILGFWVHRMALMSKIITGRYAFETVFLHAMVCDANGKKMTKSLGNVIDPVDVINGITLNELWHKSDKLRDQGLLSASEHEQAKDGQAKLMPSGIPQCGADGLRLSLIQVDFKSQVARLDVTNIAHNGRILNKMWNTFRFFDRMTKDRPPEWLSLTDVRSRQLSPVDHWILSRVSHLVTVANTCLESGDLHILYNAFHHFWINDLCDVYIEFVKCRGSHAQAGLQLSVLSLCLRTALSCIHPIIPFITEELFQRICHLHHKELRVSILEAGFPDAKDWKPIANTDLDQGMLCVSHALSKLRSLRNQMAEKADVLRLDLLLKSPHAEHMARLAVMFEKEFRPNSLSFQLQAETGKEDVKGLSDHMDWMNYKINESLTLSLKPTKAILSASINNLRQRLQRLEAKAAETSSKRPSAARKVSEKKKGYFPSTSVAYLPPVTSVSQLQALHEERVQLEQTLQTLVHKQDRL